MLYGGVAIPIPRIAADEGHCVLIMHPLYRFADRPPTTCRATSSPQPTVSGVSDLDEHNTNAGFDGRQPRIPQTQVRNTPLDNRHF